MLLAAFHISTSVKDLGLIFATAVIIGSLSFGVGWLMGRSSRR